MDRLYKDECPHCYQEGIADFIESKYLSQLGILDDVIADIQSGQHETVPQKLFDLYNNNLNKAVEQVFKKENLSNKYKEYYYHFKANATKFAAYKSSYAGSTLLKAYKDDPKNFKQNAKAILKAFNRYQVTEYNTAVSRCRTARQFVNFKETAHIYPNLEWVISRSANKRELHLAFTGTILPIDHPFWKENQPGNLYNCKCNWRQTDKAATGQSMRTVEPAKGLDGNPGNTRKMFSEKHPYFSKAPADKKQEIDNFISDCLYKQFEKVDGVNIHPLVNPKDSDYEGLVAISKNFLNKSPYIMPKLHIGSDLYKYLYTQRGAYAGKCPDLFINGHFYEYESFVGEFDKSKLGHMLRRGVKQSDRIIIDMRGVDDVNSRYIFRRIRVRITEGQNIKEAWILKDGDMLEQII